jgi:hypothetical protein
MLDARAPKIMKTVVSRSGDAAAALEGAARDLVASVDIAGVAGRHAAAASAAARDVTTRLKSLSAQAKRTRERARIVGLLAEGSPILNGEAAAKAQLDDARNKTLSAPPGDQERIVGDLRTIMLDETRARSLRKNAATSLHNLHGLGAGAVTAEDVQHALPLCGCPRA